MEFLRDYGEAVDEAKERNERLEREIRSSRQKFRRVK